MVVKCTNCGSKIIVISVKLSDIIEIQEKLNNQTSENRKHFQFRPMLSHWCDLASLSLLLFSMSAAFHDNNYLHSLHFFFVHPIVSLTWLFFSFFLQVYEVNIYSSLDWSHLLFVTQNFLNICSIHDSSLVFSHWQGFNSFFLSLSSLSPALRF